MLIIIVKIIRISSESFNSKSAAPKFQAHNFIPIWQADQFILNQSVYFVTASIQQSVDPAQKAGGKNACHWPGTRHSPEPR